MFNTKLAAITMMVFAVAMVGTSSIMSASATSNIIVNGSFEESSIDCIGGYVLLYAPSTVITGWTITDGSVDLVCLDILASNGTRSIDLSGQTLGTISQNFTSTPGTEYRVDFDMSGQRGAPLLKTMTVSAGDTSEIFTSDKNTHSGIWDAKTFYFVATDSTTTLEFKSSDDVIRPYYGPALDNVHVEALENVSEKKSCDALDKAQEKGNGKHKGISKAKANNGC